MMSNKGKELVLVYIGVWFGHIKAGISSLEWHGCWVVRKKREWGEEKDGMIMGKVLGFIEEDCRKGRCRRQGNCQIGESAFPVYITIFFSRYVIKSLTIIPRMG